MFRELKTHQKEFSSWCGECFCEKKEAKGRSIHALRKVKHLIDQAYGCLFTTRVDNSMLFIGIAETV